MEPLSTSYQPLQSQEEDNSDETPQDHAVLIHTVPPSKSRWNHIEDLDSFFFRVYHYHQNHGFACMIIQEFCELGQFIYLILLSTYVIQCLNFPLIFGQKTVPGRIQFSDVFIPAGECLASIGPLLGFCLSIACFVWLLRAIKVCMHICQYWEIKAFYNNALHISDSELDNLTWHEVQRRVREVQREQQMCIHKQDLSELDIYHRILRYKNYMVAMINKSVLPLKLKVPSYGDYMFLSHGLKYNLEMLFFWGSWAPFENTWHLKEDFKKSSKRKELADQLSKYILRVGIANFILSPLILLYQILYCFFNYTEVLKREPGSLGARRWSLYGRLYLRHFNELDHELNARLSRAYRPAVKYMDSFTSPMAALISRNLTFLMAAPLSLLVVFTILLPDTLGLEHMLTVMALLGGGITLARCFIPDEHLVWCPERLMMTVLAHAHYLPDHWRGQAHKSVVKDEFSMLFQYRALYVAEELLSPIITPFILCFCLRPRALELVDFFRNFTVEVVGVGDVCSFALMDVRKHGNPTWQVPVVPGAAPVGAATKSTQANQYTQAEDGKTELSLVHFTLTNPGWKPPAESGNFISAIRDMAQRDASCLPVLREENPLCTSLNSLSSLGIGYPALVNSIWNRPLNFQSNHGMYSAQPRGRGSGDADMAAGSVSGVSGATPAIVRGHVNLTEGPLYGSERGLLASLHQSCPGGGSLADSVMGTSHHDMTLAFSEDPRHLQSTGAVEVGIADMSLSSLYLHELHRRQIRRQGFFMDPQSRSFWQQPHQEAAPSHVIHENPDEENAERTPLLDTRLAKSS